VTSSGGKVQDANGGLYEVIDLQRADFDAVTTTPLPADGVFSFELLLKQKIVGKGKLSDSTVSTKIKCSGAFTDSGVVPAPGTAPGNSCVVVSSKVDC
jgi:hypothetical protein